MNKPTAFKTASEAVMISQLTDDRLISVSASLTSNGDGFLVADQQDGTCYWDAEGKPWHARVHCLSYDEDSLDGKFRLALEPWDGE